ncbi:MAG: DUF460 domain-containing protein [Candidatus Micrarchaeota archaeon]|nr:DUF460 domain-containing protein [Candidatus Micrarchaeota archaeon]
MEPRRHAIVGIDPGATFGIALIDLNGRKIALGSTGEGFSEAARMIERHGAPSLVACDTNPAPEAALRLASYFSCRLFVPRASIREEEKNVVARGSGAENSHQRDAYCAAVYAYRANANKLRQIEALADLAPAEKEEVKHLILRGVKVQDAFLLLREPVAKAEAVEKKSAAPARTASPEEMRSRLETLMRENSNLRMGIERLEEEKAALLHRLRLLENGVRQSLVRDAEFRKLRFQLQKSLERLNWKKNKNAGKKNPQAQKESQRENARAEKKETSEGINNLGEPGIDLKKMVEEYRKGRS